jgi:autotransporter-associated beta strand protein
MRSRCRTAALGIALYFLAVGSVRADEVYLTTGDASGTTSFNAAGHWSNGEAPSPAHDYTLGGPAEIVLRTPDLSPDDFVFGGNSLTITNNGILRYKGTTSTITIANLTVNGGTLHNGQAPGTLTLAGGIALGPNGGTLMAESADRTIIIPDAITGSGNLTASGPGTMRLTGNNSYSGQTIIRAGTPVHVGNGGTSGTLGTGVVTAHGSLIFNRSDSLTVGNAIGGTGSVTQAGSGTLILTGTNTYTKPTVISAGTLQIGNGGTVGTLGTDDVIDNGTLAFNRSDALTVSNRISGLGNLTKAGGGTTTLTADNTYSGTTLISAGTLQVGNGGATGTLGAGDVTNNATLTFNRTGDLVVTNLIVGTGTLVKNASGTLTLTAANRYAGTTTINAGALLLGIDNPVGTGLLDLRNNGTAIRSADGTTRTVTNALSISANITFGSADSGDLVFSGLVNNGGGAKQLSISNAVTTFSTLTGAGILTIRGPGVFKLAAGATINNSAAITNAAGSWFDASATAGGFTNPVGKIFTGAGTVLGDFTARGNLTPGVGGIGTMTFSNNLALSAATLNFELGSTGGIGGGTNDLLDAAGDLALSGTSPVNVFSTAGSFAPSYTLIRYGGALTGGAANFSLANTNLYRQVFALDTTTSPGSVLLGVSGSGLNLTWAGNAGPAWDDRTTANWNGGAEKFHATDSVLFDDTGATGTVTLTGTLMPASVTVAGHSDYTFTGAGKISGGTDLVKEGAGVLAVSNANDYTGTTWVRGGILRIGNSSALGTAAGGTVVTNGGTLDVNGVTFFNSDSLRISGSGFNSTGAVINTGGAVQNGIRAIALDGDASVGAWANRWDIRSPGYVGDELNLNGHTLTKLGAGQISVVQQIVTNSGSIDVTAGNLTFTRAFVGGDGAVILRSGTQLVFENFTTGYFNKAISATGATVRLIGSNLGIGSAVSLESANAVDVAAAMTLTWSNTVSGSGSIAKVGAGTLDLLGNNTYSGPTAISNGTLRVNGAYTGGGLITVFSNATLGGAGSAGAVTVSDGGILAPGNSAGTLTVGGTLTLGGSSLLSFELAAPNAATGGNGSDFINGVDALTLDGVLNVTGLAGFTTTIGSSWRLIEYGGLLTDNGLTVGTAPVLADPEASYQISTDGDAIYLTVIPEPASAGLIIWMGLVALLSRRRWRTSRSPPTCLA